MTYNTLRATLPGVGEKRLFSLNTEDGNGLLAFREQPVNERLAIHRFHMGCFLGFTSITPYWLNKRLSPSIRMAKLPRFLKLIQVPRSVRE